MKAQSVEKAQNGAWHEKEYKKEKWKKVSVDRGRGRFGKALTLVEKERESEKWILT